MKKSWYHLVARTQHGLFPFWQRRFALPLWKRLQLEFRNNTLAAVIMPDHIHLLIESSRPDYHRQRLGFTLGAYTRSFFPGKKLWQSCPQAEPIRDLQKLEATIRYIHLNPCRRSYTPNPWAWEFSTLWDHSGWSIALATDQKPWVSGTLIEYATSRSWQTWSDRQRDFVLMDPSVSVSDLTPRHPLHELNDLEFKWLVNRSFKTDGGVLKKRDSARELWIRLIARYHLPDRSHRELAKILSVCRTRLGLILKEDLTQAEQAYFERHAGWVRHGSSVVGHRLSPRCDLITERILISRA